MEHTRDVNQRVCTNGHDIDDYPEEFHDAVRIGINFRGWVEYADVDEGTIYEVVYQHGRRVYSSTRTHDLIGDDIETHIECSHARFGDWRFVESV